MDFRIQFYDQTNDRMSEAFHVPASEIASSHCTTVKDLKNIALSLVLDEAWLEQANLHTSMLQTLDGDRSVLPPRLKISQLAPLLYVIVSRHDIFELITDGRSFPRSSFQVEQAQAAPVTTVSETPAPQAATSGYKMHTLGTGNTGMGISSNPHDPPRAYLSNGYSAPLPASHDISTPLHLASQPVTSTPFIPGILSTSSSVEGHPIIHSSRLDHNMGALSYGGQPPRERSRSPMHRRRASSPSADNSRYELDRFTRRSPKPSTHMPPPSSLAPNPPVPLMYDAPATHAPARAPLEMYENYTYEARDRLQLKIRIDDFSPFEWQMPHPSGEVSIQPLSVPDMLHGFDTGSLWPDLLVRQVSPEGSAHWWPLGYIVEEVRARFVLSSMNGWVSMMPKKRAMLVHFLLRRSINPYDINNDVVTLMHDAPAEAIRMVFDHLLSTSIRVNKTWSHVIIATLKREIRDGTLAAGGGKDIKSREVQHASDRKGSWGREATGPGRSSSRSAGPSIKK